MRNAECEARNGWKLRKVVKFWALRFELGGNVLRTPLSCQAPWQFEPRERAQSSTRAAIASLAIVLTAIKRFTSPTFPTPHSALRTPHSQGAVMAVAPAGIGWRVVLPPGQRTDRAVGRFAAVRTWTAASWDQ